MGKARGIVYRAISTHLIRKTETRMLDLQSLKRIFSSFSTVVIRGF